MSIDYESEHRFAEHEHGEHPTAWEPELILSIPNDIRADQLDVSTTDQV